MLGDHNRSNNIAEWVTALGEIAIAGVIVLEMQVNRRDPFLTEAAKIEHYRARGRVYAAIYDTVGDTTAEKREAFCKRIWKERDQDLRSEDREQESSLKDSCEQQIVLFGRLEQIRRRALFFGRDYVELFPHAVVMFWIMVGPYIEERRRMTGDW
jgi:hypothetical protein